MEGRFFIGELDDGRFVAASNASPAFCFRGNSEDDVLNKVRKHLGAYLAFKGSGGQVKILSVTNNITTVQPTKSLSVQEVLCHV
jgi:hypothetical protein